MSEPFIGEIRMFTGNFAPRGWALCDGQFLSISEHTVLFSIVGTTYGGDGRTTFRLPDLRGRFPLHVGTGPGLTPRSLGSRGGLETVGLTASHLASHTHRFNVPCSAEDGEQSSPVGRFPAVSRNAYVDEPDALMGEGATGGTGAGARHENMPPFFCIAFIIALQGRLPTRE